MSDETEEYIESVSIPTLVWIGEPGSGRREMASAFVKARFSTMALDGTIAEKPEWNPVLPDGDGAESLQKGLRKDHYARICLFDAPKGEEADALMRGAYDKPLSKALRGAHVLVWFVSCPRLPDPGMLGLLRTMRAICPDVPLLIAAGGIENAGEDYRADGFDIDDGQSHAEETARNWLARLREEFTPYSPKDVIPCSLFCIALPDNRRVCAQNGHGIGVPVQLQLFGVGFDRFGDFFKSFFLRYHRRKRFKAFGVFYVCIRLFKCRSRLSGKIDPLRKFF